MPGSSSKVGDRIQEVQLVGDRIQEVQLVGGIRENS